MHEELMHVHVCVLRDGCMCACVSALQTLTSLAVMLGEAKAQERCWPCCYSNLNWSRHLSASVHVSVCACVCLYICVFTHGHVYLEASQNRAERKMGKTVCCKLVYSVPCTGWVWVWAMETLLALHDATLAVGVVNGVHTLFSPQWSTEWVCGEPWPAERGG